MTTNLWQQDIKQIVMESAGTVSALGEIQADLGRTAELISERLRAGSCVFVFGNGGSAAQAQHLAAELVGRFEAERRALAAVALTCDTSTITSVGNDYGFEEIFARQLRGLARPGDVALGISTSGNSPNVLRALDAARERNLHTIGLTGRSGGALRQRVDVCLCVPSDSTPRIQEAHLVICHILCRLVENAVLSGETPGKNVRLESKP